MKGRSYQKNVFRSHVTWLIVIATAAAIVFRWVGPGLGARLLFLIGLFFFLFSFILAVLPFLLFSLTFYHLDIPEFGFRVERAASLFEHSE